MITIITLGKVKEKTVSLLVDEYVKRLSKWTKVEFLELKDERVDKQTVPEQLKLKEAERVFAALEKRKGFVVALDETGKLMDSYQFADVVKKESIENDLIFIIGGTIGLYTSVLDKVDLCLGFGKMTFTRDMARLFLVEQLFRAHKINSGEGYQK